jgi:Pyruvate/2-oxoacid:ferredoxin oxidoreductase delta subunit
MSTLGGARRTVPATLSDVPQPVGHRGRPLVPELTSLLRLGTGAARKIGAVLVSGDYGAIDVATCRLMSIDLLGVCTVKAAVERGYLRQDLSDVALVGDALDPLVVRDYGGPSTYVGRGREGLRARGFIGVVSRLINQATARPVIQRSLCTSCVRCYRSCPTETIEIVGTVPVVRHDRCIRCYCCHEMCDSHAIKLERTIVGKVVARLAAG